MSQKEIVDRFVTDLSNLEHQIGEALHSKVTSEKTITHLEKQAGLIADKLAGLGEGGAHTSADKYGLSAFELTEQLMEVES